MLPILKICRKLENFKIRAKHVQVIEVPSVLELEIEILHVQEEKTAR